jgi:hypothetical protein
MQRREKYLDDAITQMFEISHELARIGTNVIFSNGAHRLNDIDDSPLLASIRG